MNDRAINLIREYKNYDFLAEGLREKGRYGGERKKGGAVSIKCLAEQKEKNFRPRVVRTTYYFFPVFLLQTFIARP